MGRWLVVMAAIFPWVMASAAAPPEPEVIPVSPIRNCFLCSSVPSLTLFRQGVDPRAVLIFIPGGDGYLGLKPGAKGNGKELSRSLGWLTDPKVTSGHLDLVVLDSPSPLSPNQPYPSAREGEDHLIRIESAIRYYKDKTHLPIWLMGHSNGGISLSAFLKYAQERGNMDLISGIVASNIRTESYFKAPIQVPFLFLHDSNDLCSRTLLSATQDDYAQVRAFDKAQVSFAEIISGRTDSGNPCVSGYHMYHGAGLEVVKAIDQFMGGVYPGSSGPMKSGGDKVSMVSNAPMSH